MATQPVERNLLNLYREGKTSLVCFLPLKREKCLAPAASFLRLETLGLPACYPLTAFMESLFHELDRLLNRLVMSCYVIVKGYIGCKSFQFFPERSQDYSQSGE